MLVLFKSYNSIELQGPPLPPRYWEISVENILYELQRGVSTGDWRGCLIIMRYEVQRYKGT